MIISDSLRDLSQQFHDLSKGLCLGTIKNMSSIADTLPLKKLVEKRDLLDFNVYHQAVKTVFPENSYTVNVIANNTFLKTSEKESTYVRYIFEITCNSAHTGKCLVIMNAPGSRALTSDVDTLIRTCIDSEFSIDKAQGFQGINFVDKGPDYGKHITNALIEYFYRIKEELGSIAPDSNAYVDIAHEDLEIYPKFKNDEENNPTVRGEKTERRLFRPDEFRIFFNQFKKKKHTQELAASLFSLRDALIDTEWMEFTTQVINLISQFFPCCLKNGPHWQLDLVKKDCEDIFSLVHKLHQNYKDSISKKILEIKKEYAQKPSDALSEEKFKLIAKNRLYVTWLEGCAKLQNEIHKQMIKFNHAKELLNEKRNCLESQKQCMELETFLKNSVKEIAENKLQKQYIQMVANTFANDAYICSSAIYHVVNGQYNKPIHMSEQRCLASALQQAGFKLLHIGTEKDKKNSIQTAYATAKYGQRIFTLIKNPIKPDENNSEVKSQPFSYSCFTQQELILLQYQAKIIDLVKKNDKILEKDKLKETKELLCAMAKKFYPEESESKSINHFLEDEKSLFLSISAKLIAIGFTSRLVRKGYLWGSEGDVVPKQGD